MTTDITELAQRVERIISDVKLKHGGNDTYAPIMKWDEFLALVEALEKTQQRIASQREYYEGVIADGGKRIAELESCVSNLKVNRPAVYGDGFHEGYWKARSEQSMSSEDENHG
ncbi:hypothetical protein [Klebsiella pneumoniae]|uniref:hypothetical protein n=1 Tax=Klebsiella pneumoniae TaxID=573 RepID=UPI001F0F1026|nr:hypothetical protein [Klebsiella pneumoniae]UMU83933.1 hypothetical protein HZT31_19110 [Klebsiella pneumoniae]